MKENLARENTSTFEIVVNTYNYINDYDLEETLFEKYGKDGTTSFPIVMSRYLADEYGFDINANTITQQINLFKYFHPEIVEMIFKNELTVKDAKSLLSTYKKLSDEEKNIADDLIKKGNYEKVKELRIKKKTTKISKTFKAKEVVDIIKKIKNDEMSCDEAIDYIEQKK